MKLYHVSYDPVPASNFASCITACHTKTIPHPAYYGDALIAFWDGESNSTRHMVEYMRSMGNPVRIQNYTKG